MRVGIEPTCLGDDVAVWDLKERKVIQTADLGEHSGALMAHWAMEPGVRRAYINAPGTSAIWLADDDDGDGVYDFQQVLGPEDGLALPPDMVLSHDGTAMYVSNWFGDSVQKFDLTDPFDPVLEDTVSVPHPNMLRLSRDDRRLYVTNSLLTPWDNDPDFGPGTTSTASGSSRWTGSSARPRPAEPVGQLRERPQEDDDRPGRAARSSSTRASRSRTESTEPAEGRAATAAARPPPLSSACALSK